MTKICAKRSQAGENDVCQKRVHKGLKKGSRAKRVLGKIGVCQKRIPDCEAVAGTEGLWAMGKVAGITKIIEQIRCLIIY